MQGVQANHLVQGVLSICLVQGAFAIGIVQGVLAGDKLLLNCGKLVLWSLTGSADAAGRREGTLENGGRRAAAAATPTAEAEAPISSKSDYEGSME